MAELKTMEEAFEQLGAENAQVNVPEAGTVVASEKKSRKSADEVALEENLKQTVATDEEYVKEHGTLSDSIEVLNTLGFSDVGDQIFDKAASEAAGSRKLAAVGRIVGYIVKNNSKQAIPYTTYQCTKKADGTGYDAQEVQATLAPGKKAILSKRHLIIMASQPAISFKLANAVLRKAPNQKIVGAKPEDVENLFFLAFEKGEDGKSVSVHSDKVKKQIGEKNADGKWLVKPEYAEVLGFVENEKVKEARVKGAAGPKYTSRDAQALYVAKLFSNTGV